MTATTQPVRAGRPFKGQEPGAHPPPPDHPKHGPAEAVYTYRDEAGQPLFCVCRFATPEGKTFLQGRELPSGQWVWNLRGIQPVLYRLPEVQAWLGRNDKREPLYICEGEKDVQACLEALEREGRKGEATCNPMGAGKWRDPYTDTLHGAWGPVYVVADHDESGIAHGRHVVQQLRPHVASVELVRGAVHEPKADLSDHLAAGHTLEELVPLEPEAAEPPSEPARLWLRSAGDLLRRDDPGPTPYLVEDLIVEAAIAALQGAGKVGKTWTILELARAIITGGLAFGRFAVPAPPGPVIVLLEESGEAALHRRLAGLMRGNAQRPEDFDQLFYGANLGVKLTEPRWQERLVAAAVELRPRAVFLDPLVRMKGAGVDENVQREIAAVLETILELRERAGAAVVFAHHTGHDGKHLRGSSDLEAFWESKIVVAKLEDGRREVRSEHREAEAGPTWHYRLAWDHETRSVRLRAEEEPKRREVAEHLRAHPEASGNEVFKAVGGNRAEVLELVKELRDQLSLSELEEGGTSTLVPPRYQEPGASGPAVVPGGGIEPEGLSPNVPPTVHEAAEVVPGPSEEEPAAEEPGPAPQAERQPDENGNVEW